MVSLVTVSFESGPRSIFYAHFPSTVDAPHRNLELHERLKRLRYVGPVHASPGDRCLDIGSVARGPSDRHYSIREIEECMRQFDYELFGGR